MLRRCLTNLVALPESDDLEIIVVDNGSKDGSVEMLREEFPSLHRIENAQNLGFSRATNQAFEQATADYVLMLNSDTVVGAGTISQCILYLESNKGIGAIGCQLRNEDGSEQSTAFRFPSLFGLLMGSMRIAQTFPTSPMLNRDRYGGRRWRGPTAVDVVMGSFLMVNRAALPSPPLLDERYFMYAEETDLCRRLRDAGAGVVFLPEVSVTHVGGGSFENHGSAGVVGRRQETRHSAILVYVAWRCRGLDGQSDLAGGNAATGHRVGGTRHVAIRTHRAPAPTSPTQSALVAHAFCGPCGSQEGA